MIRDKMLAAGHGKFAVLGALLLLATVLVALTAANCADIIEFRGPKPTEIVQDAAGPVPVIVIVDNAPIRSAPGSMWGTIGNANWRDQWWLTREVKGDDGAPYVLAAKKDDDGRPTEFVGWLKEEDCLLSTEALMTEEHIYKKAMIVTRWRTAKGETKIAGANCYNQPGTADESAEVIKLTLFDLYYVFAVRSVDGAKYYLLGTGPLIRPPGPPPGRVLVGWAHEGRVQEWNTRQGLEYNKDNLYERVSEKDRQAGKGGARIFRTSEEAEKAARGEQVTCVAEEDSSKGAWEPGVMRYPIRKVETGDTVDMRFFHIGYVGDKISPEGGVVLTREAVEDYQKRLAEIRESFCRVDVLFVIDSTGSMRLYFEPVAEAVEAIMDIIKSEYPGGLQPDFRFSITFYRDYCDKDGKPQPDDTYLVKRLSLTNNVEAIRDFLEREVIPRDAGGDEPEAVFYGITHAIAEAKKGELREGPKLLILMGDKGNHEDHPRDSEQKLNAENVADLLVRNDFDFFVMHAFDPARVGNDPDAARFRDQANEIIRSLKGNGAGSVASTGIPAWRPFGQYAASGKPKDVASRIKKTLEDKLEVAEKGAEVVTRLEPGSETPDTLKRKYDTYITSLVLKMMQEAGIDLEEFFGEGVQVFDEGWIAERDLPGKPVQIKEMVYVSMPEIGQMVGILAGFLGETRGGVALRNAWTATLKEQLGEEIDLDKTIEQLIKNRLGLPVRRKLLQRTVEEVANMPAEELVKACGELRKDYWGLLAILAQKKLIELKDDNGNTTFKLGDDHPVFDDNKGGIPFGWIPLEKMP